MTYKYCSQKCDFCLAEKVAIARFEGVGLLNKQTEFLLIVDIDINLL